MGILFNVGSEGAKKFIWPVDFSMDYRYLNHVPGVQTSASIRGESCQAELCHVSCVNLLQHNEKTAVALHLIQFHPLTLPPAIFTSLVMIAILKHLFSLPTSCIQGVTLYLNLNTAATVFHHEGSDIRLHLKKNTHLRQTTQLFFFGGGGVFSNKDSSSK